MSYYIQKAIPNFTFEEKENIPALTGTVISSQYHLSISDYLNLNLTINGISEAINVIFSYNRSFLNENGLLDINSISSNIDNIITANFTCINTLNGQPITTETQNINVLKSFKINNVYYSFNDQNQGNIILSGRYISGHPEDYVQTFNGRTGDVKGAIEKIIINNRVSTIEDGLVTIDGLVDSENCVISVDGLYNRIYLLYQLKVYDDVILTASELNQGSVVINTQFYSGGILADNITLDTVNENNKHTAITKKFLNSYLNTNDPLILTMVYSNNNPIVLDKQWYPLHFYNASGNWLPNVTWTETENLNDPSKHDFTITNDTNVAKFTIMKVNND